MKRRRSLVLVFVLGLLLMSSGVFLLSAQPEAFQDDDEVDPLGDPPTFLAGYYDAWVNSPHARFEDDAFRHWDEDEEAVVPESCATCHSTPGYIDFLGADGSEAGVVDAPAPLGTVVNCDACHNPVAASMDTIAFPSGAEVTELGDSVRCMVCHQGRNSGLSVASAIEEAGMMEEPNTVNEEFGFINIHYYAAASTIYGSEVTGGYEYPGNSYTMRSEHVEGYDTCAGCHNPHTLELDLADCATCHEGVETVEDLQGIRSVGSLVDYDGDGDMSEGIAGEIDTLQEMLYEAIQIYAAEVVGAPIIWGDGYPYFFNDTDGDGEVSEGEAAFPNRYASFTPVLLQATYNYQVTLKDPGGYAHNPDYHIQLLYDSIASINEQLAEGVDLSTASRDSFGHFESSSEAFRHWDEDGAVSARCSTCHSAEGLPFFLDHGVQIEQPISNSLSCSTCHSDLSTAELYPVASVSFPSGAELTYGEESSSNICLNCHQGRQSGVQIQSAIDRAGVGDDEVSDVLNFSNPHYFSAGATVFGADANIAYQFEGMEYNGQFEHTRQFDECSDCHDAHAAAVVFEECSECHTGVETAEDLILIRGVEDAERDPVDYDGDGDVDEPLSAEIETLRNTLFELIFTYAEETLGQPIVYEPSSYPYWFIDANGNGELDEGEASRDNRYDMWSPNLMRAIYNYQYINGDPGAYAHNGQYVLQVLYDTIEAVGGEEAVATFNRAPVVVADED